MEVLIDNRQNKRKLSLRKISQAAKAILNALECPEGELSIVIVDDPQIAELNAQYLNRQGPTNVIAFPMQEGEFSGISPYLLGDVVISADTAQKEADDQETSLEKRFCELLIHGILHLFGYDHEKDETQADEMEKKSRDLLEVIEKIS